MTKRRFSLEEDFMSYDTDDLLYGYLYHLSTFHPVEKRLYLTMKCYGEHRRDMYNICGFNNSTTLRRHLEKLKDKGLVKDETMKVGDKEVPVLTFPYDYDGNYELIDNEMLWYVISTRNKQAVRVYVYLLNCYNWKEKEDSQFIFTNKDILKALDYSIDNKTMSSWITNILESFDREGILKIDSYYEEKILDDGSRFLTPKMKLSFIAKRKEELRKCEFSRSKEH